MTRACFLYPSSVIHYLLSIWSAVRQRGHVSRLLEGRGVRKELRCLGGGWWGQDSEYITLTITWAELKCKFSTTFGILNRYNENVLWLRIFLVWHLLVNSCPRSKWSALLQQKCPCIIGIWSIIIHWFHKIQTSLQRPWLCNPQFSWHSWARNCCWALMLIEICTGQPLNIYDDIEK